MKQIFKVTREELARAVITYFKGEPGFTELEGELLPPTNKTSERCDEPLDFGTVGKAWATAVAYNADETTQLRIAEAVKALLAPKTSGEYCCETIAWGRKVHKASCPLRPTSTQKIEELIKFPDPIEVITYITPHGWNVLADKINELIRAHNDRK